MGYGQFLRDLLSPLGVYDLSPGSFSGGEVEALGAVLDQFWAEAQEGQRQSLIQTASDQGLTRWERLLPHRAAGTSLEERRRAIGGFLSIGDDSFTAESLRRCLVACGLEVVVEETDRQGVVTVQFPDVMGQPEGFAGIKTIIEEILPCQLQVEYKLRFCTWGDSAQVTWGQLGNITWEMWERYRV